MLTRFLGTTTSFDRLAFDASRFQIDTAARATECVQFASRGIIG